MTGWGDLLIFADGYLFFLIFYSLYNKDGFSFAYF